MKAKMIEVEDLGQGIFVDRKTKETYIWDLEDGILGFIENQSTLEKLNVVEDFRDENDNVEAFMVECE